jgi:hypothetical protein
MPTSLDEKLEQAIAFFKEATERARREPDRALHTHLEAMAAGIQENRRVLDYLQTRMEEIQRELGSH